MITISPNLSSVVEKVSSRTSVMSLSLREKNQSVNLEVRKSYLQHPLQATIKLNIDTFQIGKRYPFLQNHLIEANNKVCI